MSDRYPVCAPSPPLLPSPAPSAPLAFKAPLLCTAEPWPDGLARAELPLPAPPACTSAAARPVAAAPASRRVPTIRRARTPLRGTLEPPPAGCFSTATIGGAAAVGAAGGVLRREAPRLVAGSRAVNRPCDTASESTWLLATLRMEGTDGMAMAAAAAAAAAPPPPALAPSVASLPPVALLWSDAVRNSAEYWAPLSTWRRLREPGCRRGRRCAPCGAASRRAAARSPPALLARPLLARPLRRRLRSSRGTRAATTRGTPLSSLSSLSSLEEELSVEELSSESDTLPMSHAGGV